MRPQDAFDRIQGYLQGKIEGDERRDFEKHLEEDQGLQEQVKKHEMANRLVLYNRLRLAKEASLHVERHYKKQLKYKKWAFMLLAGLVLLAGSIGAWLYFAGKKEQSKVQTKRNTTVAQKPFLPLGQKPLAANPKAKPQKEIGVTIQPKVQQSEMEPATYTEEEKSTPLLSSVESGTSFAEKPIPIPSKKQEIASVENTCNQVKIHANVHISNTCKGQSTGVVKLSDYQGGTAPYHFQVFSSDLSQTLSATSLPLGTYNVYITDANHCVGKIEHVLIKEISCTSEEEETAFNPYLNEFLELPASDKQRTFSVYKVDGTLFYKKEIMNGEKIEWDGTSIEGKREPGHFSYYIQYQDGTVTRGMLTVLH